MICKENDTPPNADMTKYCHYHRNHGHTTEECKALQDKIEELVRAGHFRRFIRRDDHSSSSRTCHPPRSDHRRPPHDARHDRHPTQPTSQDREPARTDITPADPRLRGFINTIFGGFASGGSTSSARKRHLCHIQSINHITHSHHRRRMPHIVFTDDDFHGLDHQQDDPMVITVEIENCAVKKVLVDQGSSVDILYWATYQKLQLPNTAMVPYDEPNMAFLANRYPPGVTLTSTPSFGREPKPKPSQYASLSSTRQHPTTSSWAVLPSIPLAPSSPPITWPWSSLPRPATSLPSTTTSAWHVNATWPACDHNSQSNKPTISNDPLAPI